MRSAVALAAVAVHSLSAASSVGASHGFIPSEIVRVWLDGQRINLSRSAAGDTAVVVSPNGKRVAFVRDGSIYVARTDGRGVSRWSSNLGADQAFGGQIAWSPDSNRLAVASTACTTVPCHSTLYVIGPGRRQRPIARGNLIFSPVWPASGRTVVFDDVREDATPSRGEFITGRFVRSVTDEGERDWRIRGEARGADAWSPRGFVAIRSRTPGQTGRAWPWIRIYDEGGQLRAALHGRAAAWSPRGGRIAVIVQNRLEVRSVLGRLLFSRGIRALSAQQRGITWGALRWLDGDHVLIGVPNARPLLVDVEAETVSRGRNAYWGSLSPDRRMVASIAYRRRNGIPVSVAMTVTTLHRHRTRALTPYRRCPDLVNGGVAWLPDGRSLIYYYACQAQE
jgi:hypothetical protein